MDATRKPRRHTGGAVFVCTDPDLETLTGRAWLNEWWRRENRPPLAVTPWGDPQSHRWQAACRACAVPAGDDERNALLAAGAPRERAFTVALAHLRDRHTHAYAVDPL